MAQGRRGSQSYVILDGQSYVLQLVNGRPQFASGTRAAQNIPRIFASGSKQGQSLTTDDFDVSLLDNAPSGIGIGIHSYNQGQPLLATEPDGLRIPPTVTRPTMPSSPSLPIRYWFETQDTGGKWLLFAITPRHIITIDIDANTPVVRRVDAASAIANANDFFGQPVLVLSDAAATGTVKPRYLIPCNNGDAILELTTVGTGGAVGSTLSTWTRFTTVVKGASHLDALPDGRYVRWNSSHSAGALLSPPRAEISIMAAALAGRGDQNASWGAGFPVKEQGIYGTALEHYGDLTIAVKQDGAYAAVSNSDGTLSWSSLLDVKFQQTGTPTTLLVHKPFVWGAEMYVPTPTGGITRVVPGQSAKPVGLNAIKENVESAAYSKMVKQSTIATGEAADRWAYMPHVDVTNLNCYIMAVRRREGDDAPGTNDLAWNAIAGTIVTGATSQGVHRQINGTFALSVTNGGRLFFGDNTNGGDISWIALGSDGSPVMTSTQGNASFGAFSTDYFAELMETDFGGPALIREFEWYIANSATTLTWAVLSGGSLNVSPSLLAPAVASGKTWVTPGSSDTATRYVTFVLRGSTSGAYSPVIPGVIAKRLQCRGTYIPEVTDDLTFVVDVVASAKRQKKSPGAVVSALKTLRNQKSAAWVDQHVQDFTLSGYVLVKDIALSDAPKNADGELGASYVTVVATLLRYS